jgi:hypothetical protein
MKVKFFLLILSFGVLISCESDENSTNTKVKFADKSLSYNSCWLPIATGGYLMAIHIIYDDSSSPTGKSKLYFSTSFSQCTNGLPEANKTYNIPGNGSCRIGGAVLYILDDPNPRTYTGTTWPAVGSITFTKVEMNLEKKTIQMAGTYNLTFTDGLSNQHTVSNVSFDMTDNY